MIPIATKIADRLHIRSYFDIQIRKARAGIVRDKRKVIYFTDELHEEFSITDITPRVIGDDYCYEPKGVWKRITRFFWYRIVATPCAYLYVKVFFRHRVTGRKKFKAFRRHGYFLYGNHTQDWADAFIPSIINFPQQDFVIVHPNNVSIPYVGKVTPSMGALPLPDTKAAGLHFMRALSHKIAEGHTVVIYPEAHIWPYYTGIRAFPDPSFLYPARMKCPVFCFTNTYQKRKNGKARIVTYIDGPFYPNEALPVKDRAAALRDTVYKTMCRRAENSDIEVIRYERKEENQ